METAVILLLAATITAMSIQLYHEVMHRTWKKAFYDAFNDWTEKYGILSWQPIPWNAYKELEESMIKAYLGNKLSDHLILALKDFIIAIDDGEPEKLSGAYAGAVQAQVQLYCLYERCTSKSSVLSAYKLSSG